MRLPILSAGGEGSFAARKGVAYPRIEPSDLDCTVNGWCKCKDEGGTRTVSGDASGATADECCMNAMNAMKDDCVTLCANLGGRDKSEPCICSAIPDLYDCGPH